MTDQWGADADHRLEQGPIGWRCLSPLGDRIGRLVGAPADSTVVGDTLSIKVYQAVASALETRPGRKIVLSDNGNFPTDLYMADGLLDSLKQGHDLKVVDPEAVADNDSRGAWQW
jgi:kynureninase